MNDADSERVVGPDDRPIQLLVDTLHREIAAYRRFKRNRILRRVTWALMLLTVWWYAGFNFGGFWWMWILFGGSAAADIAAGSRRELVTSLSSTDDPRVVSVLAVAARDGDPDTRWVASQGLKQLLLKLKASDREYLTEDGMDALLALLKCGDVELDFAILTALQQVGDVRAIPAVEAFARLPHQNMPPLFRNGWKRLTWDEQVQEAKKLRDLAAESLPFLRMRAEEDKARSTLLRAAASSDSADSLLRPAATSQEWDDQILLRPTVVSDGLSQGIDDRNTGQNQTAT